MCYKLADLLSSVTADQGPENGSDELTVMTLDYERNLCVAGCLSLVVIPPERGRRGGSCHIEL